VLTVKGDRIGAEAHHREAIRLKPDFAAAHASLGCALARWGAAEEALPFLREAVRLDPKPAISWWNLGMTLRRLGRFAEGRDALREAAARGMPRAASEARTTERIAEIEPRLDAVLSGTARPEDPEERVLFAMLCNWRALHAAATRLFQEAFDADAALAGDVERGLRFDAACAAARAGSGRAKDAASLGEAGRARCRAQALAWLRADFALREAESRSDPAGVRDKLRAWRFDHDLAGIRDEADLAKMPAAEREACRALWRDVEALYERTARPPPESRR
jgi:tetratricopeptide (TPR) repeat protein